MTAKQPPRTSADGPVRLDRAPGERLRLSVTTDGKAQDMVLTSHNAWRVFGLLAFMLGISLPTKLLLGIRMRDDPVALASPADKLRALAEVAARSFFAAARGQLARVKTRGRSAARALVLLRRKVDELRDGFFRDVESADWIRALAAWNDHGPERLRQALSDADPSFLASFDLQPFEPPPP